jgi:hypothetical protein
MVKTIQPVFLAWLLIPILLTWVSVSYLMGQITPSHWQASLPKQSNIKQIPAIASYQWDNQGLVTIWFDDAWLSQYQTAFPIMERYGFKGAVAVPTGHIGYESYMNWHQVKRLQFLGWEISAHSREHNCFLDVVGYSSIQSEILGSKEDLLKQGLQNDIYVAPCGITTPEMVNLIKSNYSSLRTVESGMNPLPIKNKYSLKIIEVNSVTDISEVKSWLQKAKQDRSWLILAFHQIDTEESYFSVTPLNFEKVLFEVKNSKLDVVLPSQVLNIKP